MPAGLYIEAHLASYHSVIRPVVCATHGPCLSYVMNVALSDYNVIYLHDKQQAQARLHAMKEAWWSDRASEIQQASDQKDAKCFYDGLKAVV